MEQPIMPANPLGGQNLKQKRDSNSPDPPPNVGIQYKKRGKITVVACIPCRKRKSKAREGHGCHYDMTNEQRRLTVLREQVGNVSEEKSTLESIIMTLQTASEQDTAEVVRRLRAGVDIQTLAQQLHAVQLLTGVGRENNTPEYTAYSGPSDYYTAHQPSSRPISPLTTNKYEGLVKFLSSCSRSETEEVSRRLHAGEDPTVILAARAAGTLRPQVQQLRATPGIEEEYASQDHAFGMVDNFVRQAAGVSHSPFGNMLSGPAYQWTSVTDDADYIEYLMSLYFCWLHPLFQSFPEGNFRHDFAAGSTKYCSSLLVNAVCAAGCTFSDRASARSNPLDYRTAGLDFFEEAVRLLHLVEDPTITSVAATYILSHLENARGRLSSSWCYAGQSGRMALDIKLHLKTEMTVENMTERKARQHTFWGCFIGDQIASFTLGRLPQFQTNSITIELPAISTEDDSQPWQQPGAASSGSPSSQSSVFHELARLSKVVNSTLNLFFAPSRVVCGAVYLDEYKKYLAWRAHLPPCLTTTENAPPHVLSLHMYYEAAILHLFRPLLRAKFTSSNINPRQLCRTSADAISELFVQYKQSTGLNGICTFQLSCLQAACSIHIINLPAIMPTKYLTDALNVFQDMAYSNAWASGSLNLVRDLVERWGVTLPMEVEAVLYRNSNTQLPNFNFSPPQPPSEGHASTRVSPESWEAGGRPGKRPRVETLGQTAHRASDYLFAPFPNQPTPLLGPMHTWSSDDVNWNNEINMQAQEFDGLDFSADPYFSFFPNMDFQQGMDEMYMLQNTGSGSIY